MKQMLTLAGLLCVAGAASLWFSGAGADRGERRTLVLTGSSTVAPLAAEIGKRFESLHAGVRVDVQTGGSSRGIADTRQAVADIGMASRALKNEEHDLFAFTIAQDGVCLIAHRDNPVEALTDKQVVAIYTGRMTNWKDVGERDAPITVVNKAEGRSTLELFLKHFQLKNSEVRPHVVIGDNEQGIKTVAGNPNAIGYVSIGTAEYDTNHRVPIKLLPIGGVEASIENVSAGTFPLSRPLNLVTLTEPEGLAKTFIEFARSRGVHDIVRSQYFVPAAN
ncbi:MAG: phosphate transport system substrate-binding protein [Pseudohongiellaceae bacterium]|jgi:phosphate transport system substrate-binding protein